MLIENGNIEDLSEVFVENPVESTLKIREFEKQFLPPQNFYRARQ